jgi:hypothetical protein
MSIPCRVANSGCGLGTWSSYLNGIDALARRDLMRCSIVPCCQAGESSWHPPHTSRFRCLAWLRRQGNGRFASRMITAQQPEVHNWFGSVTSRGRDRRAVGGCGSVRGAMERRRAASGSCSRTSSGAVGQPRSAPRDRQARLRHLGAAPPPRVASRRSRGPPPR